MESFGIRVRDCGILRTKVQHHYHKGPQYMLGQCRKSTVKLLGLIKAHSSCYS